MRTLFFPYSDYELRFFTRLRTNWKGGTIYLECHCHHIISLLCIGLFCLFIHYLFCLYIVKLLATPKPKQSQMVFTPDWTFNQNINFVIYTRRYAMDDSTQFYLIDRETFQTRICDCAFYANLVCIAKTFALGIIFRYFSHSQTV